MEARPGIGFSYREDEGESVLWQIEAEANFGMYDFQRPGKTAEAVANILGYGVVFGVFSVAAFMAAKRKILQVGSFLGHPIKKLQEPFTDDDPTHQNS